MATLTLTPSTNSISASVTGLSSAHSRVRYFYWYVDGSLHKTTTLAAYGSSHSTSLTGLSSGTRYSVTVEICEAPSYNSGQLLATLSGSATTTAAATSTLSMYSWSATDTTMTLTFRWSGTHSGSKTIMVLWYDDNSVHEATVSGTSGTKSFTFTGLSPSTSYSFVAAIYDDSTGDELSNYQNTYTTDEKTVATGTLGLTLSATQNSVTLTMKWTASISASYTITILWYADNTTHNITVSGTSGTKTYTFTGLDPKTEYSCVVGLYDADGNYLASDQNTITTSNESFAWTYAGLDSNGTPVAGTRKVAGYGIYVQAAEWNQLIEVIETNFSVSLDAAKVYSGQSITAYVYNLAANVVGVSTVTKDVTEIAASHFNALMDAANA